MYVCRIATPRRALSISGLFRVLKFAFLFLNRRLYFSSPREIEKSHFVAASFIPRRNVESKLEPLVNASHYRDNAAARYNIA